LRASLTLATDTPTTAAISESDGFLPWLYRIARRASFTLRMMHSILACTSIIVMDGFTSTRFFFLTGTNWKIKHVIGKWLQREAYRQQGDS